MRTVILLIALIWTTLAAAQGTDGSDRPGDWRVTHYESYGIWNSVCDERGPTEALTQRCYIRWVDVFSPRPNFAAMFLFVTSGEDGAAVEFGMEPGTLFLPGDFRIEKDGAVIWFSNRPGCLTGLSCLFAREEAAELLLAMRNGGALRFTFRDRHGQGQDLTWPLDGIADAIADFERNLNARGL